MFVARVLPLFLIFATAQAHAGAWLQPEGHGQVIMQATYFGNNEYWDRQGRVRPQATYSKYELQPYAEYGLLGNLTISGTGFIQHDRQAGKSNNGIADPSVFARMKLWSDDVQVVSIQPLVKVESYFQRQAAPRGGSQSTDMELSLLYGRSLNLISNRDYLDINAGYRYRSGFLNDQYHADASLGLGLGSNWLVVPAVRTIMARKIPAGMAFAENGDQDYDMLKMEVGAHYWLDRDSTIGLTVFDVVAGRQTGNGSGATISYGQQF